MLLMSAWMAIPLLFVGCIIGVAAMALMAIGSIADEAERQHEDEEAYYDRRLRELNRPVEDEIA